MILGYIIGLVLVIGGTVKFISDNLEGFARVGVALVIATPFIFLMVIYIVALVIGGKL